MDIHGPVTFIVTKRRVPAGKASMPTPASAPAELESQAEAGLIWAVGIQQCQVQCFGWHTGIVQGAGWSFEHTSC